MNNCKPNTAKGSRSPTAALDLERAERAIKRRRPDDGITFRSVHAALGWYFEAKERMKGPKGRHPAGETARDGSTVVVRVDGGKGGDLDDVFATMLTIEMALARLKGRYPRGFAVLVETHLNGTSLRDLADQMKLNRQALARELDASERFMVGALAQDGGVLR